MSFRTKTAAYFSFLMADVPHSGIDKLMLHFLRGGSAVYEHCVRSKYKPYRNAGKAKRLPAVVISLGNITIGGTGKTPMACLLARMLQSQGIPVAMLNRGYRSQMEKQATVMSDGAHILLTPEQGGDEAYLLARLLPGIPVLVGRNRVETGQLAIEKFSSHILILDDGYQHWPLARDLDIVLIDAMNPFGNGYVIPGGILREPLDHLDRAGLFVITKADGASSVALQEIKKTLRRYNPTAPIITAAHHPDWCVPFSVWDDNQRGEYASYAVRVGQRAITVSALGNPASFEGTVKQFGYDIVDTIRFDDHHQYDEADIEKMAALAEQKQAIIVTTEKDAVKLPAERIKKFHVPIYVLGIEIEIMSGKDDLQAALSRAAGGKL